MTCETTSSLKGDESPRNSLIHDCCKSTFTLSDTGKAQRNTTAPKTSRTSCRRSAIRASRTLSCTRTWLTSSSKAIRNSSVEWPGTKRTHAHWWLPASSTSATTTETNCSGSGSIEGPRQSQHRQDEPPDNFTSARYPTK